VYWICARLELRREAVAKHFLELGGYTVYIPYIREHRVRRDRRIERLVPLFPSYGFIWIAEQQGWYRARWSIGVAALIMGGGCPACVPISILDGIRQREIRGAIELPQRSLQAGDQVRLLAGPFRGHLAIYAGMSGSERVAVLLQFLGGQQRVTLPRRDVEAVT
jgi:transcriptional antiterminator RfaH